MLRYIFYSGVCPKCYFSYPTDWMGFYCWQNHNKPLCCKRYRFLQRRICTFVVCNNTVLVYSAGYLVTYCMLKLEEYTSILWLVRVQGCRNNSGVGCLVEPVERSGRWSDEWIWGSTCCGPCSTSQSEVTDSVP